MRSLLFAVLALLCLAATARSEGWRRSYGPNKNSQRAAYAAAVYPRYYGGFHARQMQNIGMPPGDIGLRGNSAFLNPW